MLKPAVAGPLKPQEGAERSTDPAPGQGAVLPGMLAGVALLLFKDKNPVNFHSSRVWAKASASEVSHLPS